MNRTLALFLRSPGLLAVALLAALAAPLNADEPSVAPGINRYYENPNWQQWVYAFERPGREIYERRKDIVAATGIKPGMVVADIGAGTGLFTRLFAHEVGPQGKVYAVDISQTFVRNIMRTARAQGLDNVEGVVNSPKEVSLPKESIDIAFICDTYHHFEYPKSMMKSVRRALRPGGRLIVVDFRRIPGRSSPWVMGHVRAGEDAVIREIQAREFRFVEEKPLLRTNYYLVFEKA